MTTWVTLSSMRCPRNQGAEVFVPEPATHPGFDDLLAEGFEEEGLPGAWGPNTSATGDPTAIRLRWSPKLPGHIN